MNTFLLNKRRLNSITPVVTYSNKINFRFLAQSSINDPFFAPIPYEYIRGKEKVVSFVLESQEMDKTNFFTKSKLAIGMNIKYNVFIRVRRVLDYRMVGNQMAFKYNSNSDLEKLYSDVESRIEIFHQEYKSTNEDVVYFEFNFRKTDRKLLAEFEKDVKKNISTNNSEHIPTNNSGHIPTNNSGYIPINNLVNIPISINEDYLGEILPTMTKNNTITHIKMNDNGTNYNFLDLIIDKARSLKESHKDRIVLFDDGFKFYLNRDTRLYVLAIKWINDSTIQKIRYSMSGVILSHVIDRKDNEWVFRKSVSSGKEMVFRDNEIVSTKKSLVLSPIPKPTKKVEGFIANSNIGVIDTETYLDNDGIQKVYALGFKTNLVKKNIIYYIDDKTLDSSKIILDMINELLRAKYNKTTFYCHNLGGYDIVFIIKVLSMYNEENTNKYDIKTILRNDKIIQVTISRDKHSFTIKDSYAILPQSLASLGKSFEVETLKTKFPYKFSRSENLFYKGEIPNRSYYGDMSEKEYKNLYRKDWSFKGETIKYLENDLNSLHQVITKANKQVFTDYGVNITECITISGLSVRIFLKDFYKRNIPCITQASLYEDIKKAYYGGITEVYKPEGYDLYYYDVNSLYPYVALQDMPGLSGKKLEYYTEMTNLKDLFGFFYCEIEAPTDRYLGLLPVRNVSGIHFPLGRWSGWYFSEELKFAQENGYKIKVVQGYDFDRETNVFKEYVDKIYKIKSTTSNKTQKSIAKSLLNNLLGRFGISLDNAVTELVNAESFDRISQIYKITSYKKISDDNYLVTYIPKLAMDIIDANNLSIGKLLTKYKDNEVKSLSVSSIAISAAVTAYGRIHITKLKLDILKNGGQIYYSDTDSIITNRELDSSLVSPNEMGKLKLEHKIDKGIFISGKTYWIANNKGDFINKAKGINSSSLSYFDYVKLLNDIDISTAIKNESKVDWIKGDVKINSKNVTLLSDSYTKREKICLDGKWVDTRPLIIKVPDKAIDKSIGGWFYKPAELSSDKAVVLYSNTSNLTPFNDMKRNTSNNKLMNKGYTILFKHIIYSLLTWLVFGLSFIGYLYVKESELYENNIDNLDLDEINNCEKVLDIVDLPFNVNNKDNLQTIDSKNGDLDYVDLSTLSKDKPISFWEKWFGKPIVVKDQSIPYSSLNIMGRYIENSQCTIQKNSSPILTDEKVVSTFEVRRRFNLGSIAYNLSNNLLRNSSTTVVEDFDGNSSIYNPSSCGTRSSTGETWETVSSSDETCSWTTVSSNGSVMDLNLVNSNEPVGYSRLDSPITSIVDHTSEISSPVTIENSIQTTPAVNVDNSSQTLSPVTMDNHTQTISPVYVDNSTQTLSPVTIDSSTQTIYPIDVESSYQKIDLNTDSSIQTPFTKNVDNSIVITENTVNKLSVQKSSIINEKRGVYIKLIGEIISITDNPDGSENTHTTKLDLLTAGGRDMLSTLHADSYTTVHPSSTGEISNEVLTHPATNTSTDKQEHLLSEGFNNIISELMGENHKHLSVLTDSNGESSVVAEKAKNTVKYYNNTDKLFVEYPYLVKVLPEDFYKKLSIVDTSELELNKALRHWNDIIKEGCINSKYDKFNE